MMTKLSLAFVVAIATLVACSAGTDFYTSWSYKMGDTTCSPENLVMVAGTALPTGTPCVESACAVASKTGLPTRVSCSSALNTPFSSGARYSGYLPSTNCAALAAYNYTWAVTSCVAASTVVSSTMAASALATCNSGTLSTTAYLASNKCDPNFVASTETIPYTCTNNVMAVCTAAPVAPVQYQTTTNYDNPYCAGKPVMVTSKFETSSPTCTSSQGCQSGSQQECSSTIPIRYPLDSDGSLVVIQYDSADCTGTPSTYTWAPTYCGASTTGMSVKAVCGATSADLNYYSGTTSCSNTPSDIRTFNYACTQVGSHSYKSSCKQPVKVYSTYSVYTDAACTQLVSIGSSLVAVSEDCTSVSCSPGKTSGLYYKTTCDDSLQIYSGRGGMYSYNYDSSDCSGVPYSYNWVPAGYCVAMGDNSMFADCGANLITATTYNSTTCSTGGQVDFNSGNYSCNPDGDGGSAQGYCVGMSGASIIHLSATLLFALVLALVALL